jgi:hypothetical protein
MAVPSLDQAIAWFERDFDEVNIYDPKTHPPSLSASQCPNGTPYLLVINNQLCLGNLFIPVAASDQEAVSQWYAAVTSLRDLLGQPKYLWWRHRAELEEGPRVYSRLIMTHLGPYTSYTGKPNKKVAA